MSRFCNAQLQAGKITNICTILSRAKTRANLNILTL